jgi:hypothetical protein
MSHPRRLLAPISALITAVVMLVALSEPAYAADTVQVDLQGLPGHSTPNLPDPLQVVYTDTAGAGVLYTITGVITIQLDGLSPDAVQLQRFGGGGGLQSQDAGNGTVVFTDPNPVPLLRGRSQRVNYLLTFGDNAPSGDVTITVAADQNGNELGSGSATTTLGGPRFGKTTPPNTNPGFVPTFAAGPTYSLAPLPAGDAAAPISGATVPKPLYFLGGLLVALGVVTLFLIFRPAGRARAAGLVPADPRAAGGWQPQMGRAGGPQQWPVVTRPTERRPYDAGHGGAGWPVRDPGPGENPPPPWRQS